MSSYGIVEGMLGTTIYGKGWGEFFPYLAMIAAWDIIIVGSGLLVGLIYGTVAKDIKTLFTLIKTLNIILLAPVIFYIFPDWPQWIAKIFPTYWVLNPIFEIATKNANLAAGFWSLVTDYGF